MKQGSGAFAPGPVFLEVVRGRASEKRLRCRSRFSGDRADALANDDARAIVMMVTLVPAAMQAVVAVLLDHDHRLGVVVTRAPADDDGFGARGHAERDHTEGRQ